jgi:hypothetical protein
VLTLAPLADLVPEAREAHRELTLPAPPGDALGALVAAAVERLVVADAMPPDAGWPPARSNVWIRESFFGQTAQTR